MLAKDVMTPNVIPVTADTTVPEIAQVLLERRISGVPGG
jgi:CBS domain-containing protein